MSLSNLTAPLLILILAVALRFTGITFDSLWLDEGYQTVVESYGNRLPDLFNFQAKSVLYKPEHPASVACVLQNFRQVDPLCPPLYAILMNRWLTVFGGTDFSIRAFSASISSLSIMTTWLFGSALLGPSAGLFAALLQALSPFDIAYAQEARMYSLLAFFATISGAAFTLLCSREKSWRFAWFGLLYLGSTWALINTHYTGLFIWAFEIGIGFLLALLRRDWLLFAWLLLLNGCVGVFSLPWLALFQQAASIRTASFYVSRKPSLWWPAWALLARIPFNWVVFLAGKKVTAIAAPIYLTSACLLFWGVKSIVPNLLCVWKSFRLHLQMILTQRQSQGPDTHRQSASLTDARVGQKDLTGFLLVCWCLIPALILWIIDVVESHRVLEISRYLIGTAPPIFFLAGAGIACFMKKQRLAIALIAAHALFALTNNAYAHIVRQREDWREAAAMIERLTLPEDIIFVSQYYDVICLDRYLTKPHRQVGISPALGRERIQTLVHSLVGQRKTFWVLTAQEGDRVFGMMPEHYKVMSDYDLHHAIHLRKYGY